MSGKLQTWACGLGALLATLGAASCGDSGDNLVSVEVRFFTTTAAARANDVGVIVYKLDDAEISPCRELLAGGAGEPIGLKVELRDRQEIVVGANRPIAVVFAGGLSSGTKVVYAEATDENSEIYVRACALATPVDGDVVELTLE